MSAPPTQKQAKTGGGQVAATESEGFLLYHGGEVADDLKSELTRVRVDPQVTCIPDEAFAGCSNLTELQLNEGLPEIGLAAFADCTALQRVTIPSTIIVMGQCAFYGCTNLSEVILLGGQRLLNHEFLARHLAGDEGILKEEMVGLLSVVEGSTFHGCRFLTRVKISISWALSERMARLTPECRLSVEEKIRNLPRLELMQDGNVLACFPVVRWESQLIGPQGIQDTNNETAGSVYQVLQTIAFHELKEYSILIELAMWKSGIDGERARADCRVAIPGPAKSLIMEYGGFTGFLKITTDGA